MRLFPCLIALLVSGQVLLNAAETTEAERIAAARTPGPGQAKALSRLADEPPGDAGAVAAVLVDGILSKDVACRIYAGQAIRSLVTSGEDDNAFRAALAGHAGRLLSAAESAMTDTINPPLEALAGIETPSGAMTPRLIALLAPGKSFRRYTLGALARSRPLTAEIKRAVLAEARGSALTQQDLVIAMQTWPDAELVGEDIDRALVVLNDAVMGNIPPRINEILKRRGQPSPIVAGRMSELLAHPITSDARFRDALRGYAACASEEEELALVGRLLGADPRLDPDRVGSVLRYLDGRQGLPPALLSRLAVLVQDRTNSWWLRCQAARLLVNTDAAAGVSTLLTEVGEAPAWIVEVDSSHGWPIAEVDRGLAKASGAEEQLAWTIEKLLRSEFTAHEKDKDFNQRRGAIQVACLSRWIAEHPDSAGRPIVICRMLEGYTVNYAPTPAEQAQCIAYVTALLTGASFTEAALVDTRYPQGGPGELSRKVFEALVWACKPASRTATGVKASSPFLVAKGEAARLVHALRASPRLVLHADRELASSLRSFVREELHDLALCREILQTSGFSTMPIQAFMAELEAYSPKL